MNKNTTSILIRAYRVLAANNNNWPLRNTMHGQKLLIDLRNAICEETGMSEQVIQDQASVALGELLPTTEISFNVGPFGKYDRGTTGHVLNALCHLKIPLIIVEALEFTGTDGKLNWAGKEFVHYKYFDGIDQPLFYFQERKFNQQSMIMNEDNSLKPDFHLSLTTNDSPGLIVTGPIATPELQEFIRGMLTNWTSDPCYKIHTDAGAFFQGGSNDPNGGYIYIEFWKPAGAPAFVDYLNSHFIQPI